MQAKRIQLTSQTRLAGQQSDVFLAVPDDPREEVNFHNIWGSMACEPESAGANANGWWVLHIKRQNMTSVVFTEPVVNLEDSNAVIIGCGTWTAANEGPWTSETVHPQTSRNLMPGDLLVLSIFVNGVSAGAVRTNSIICAHTTRK